MDQHSSAVSKTGEAQYYEEAKGWDQDRIDSERKSKRTAWIIAGLAIAGMLLALIAVAGLTPLKEKVPYVVRVNDTTGLVDIVSLLKDSKETYSEAVAKSHVWKYVLARESYSRQAAASNYDYVGLHSTPQMGKRYLAEFHPDNPESPLNVFGKSSTVELKVRGVSMLNPNLALVRFSREVWRKGSDKPEITQWMSTVGFKYSSAKMKERDRLLNPLGFQVTEYRRDPDSLETK